MLITDTLLPAAIVRRLERAFDEALAEHAKSEGRLVDEGARSAGLGLVRELAAMPSTVDARGNPYLRLLRELPAAAGVAPGEASGRFLRAMRPVLVTSFAYGVPSDPVLDRIAAEAGAAPIVELGAGGGYWARCLRDRGATIFPFDRVLPMAQVRPGGRLCQHHPVAVGGPAEAIAAVPDAGTLLLCWPPGVSNREEADAGAPPIFSTMSMDALDRYRGPRLVFVGDHVRSFGSPAFFARLEREWHERGRLPLPNLGSWTDRAFFFERR